MTDRDGSRIRFPDRAGILRKAACLPVFSHKAQIQAGASFCPISDGAIAQGYTAVNSNRSIMTKDDCIRRRRCLRFISIRIAENNIILLTSCNSMVVPNDSIAVSLIIHCVVGTNNFRIAYVGSDVLVAVKHIVLADGAVGPGQCVTYTKELRLLRIVDLVAAADSQGSTAAIAVFYRLHQGFL